MDETSPPSGEVIHSCAWRVAYARAWRMVKVLARRSRNVRSDPDGAIARQGSEVYSVAGEARKVAVQADFYRLRVYSALRQGDIR